MNTPHLSIITVVRNGAATIARCLESIASERALLDKVFKIELIIIDGQSTDDTIKIINSYGLDYITQLDSGIYEAMNLGIKHATGEFIHFVNSDDFLLEGALSEIVHGLKLNNSCELHCFPIEIHNGITNKVKVWNPRLTYKKIHSMPLPHPGCIISRSLLLRLNGFDCNFKFSSDYDLIIKCLLLSSPIFYTYPVVSFQTGGASSRYLSCIENIKIRKKNALNISEQIFGFIIDHYRFCISII